MKDIVTFETAVRLKEAGFSQPTPEAGQWWYNPDFGPFLVGKLWMVDRRLRNIFYPDTGKVVNKEIRLFPDCVFAPTATDILRELAGFCICYLENGNSEGWTVLNYHKEYYAFDSDNPAASAAEAWLKLNDKK